MYRTGNRTGLVISLEIDDPDIKGKTTTMARLWVYAYALAAGLTRPANSPSSRSHLANRVRSLPSDIKTFSQANDPLCTPTIKCLFASIFVRVTFAKLSDRAMEVWCL